MSEQSFGSKKIVFLERNNTLGAPSGISKPAEQCVFPLLYLAREKTYSLFVMAKVKVEQSLWNANVRVQ